MYGHSWGNYILKKASIPILTQKNHTNNLKAERG